MAIYDNSSGLRNSFIGSSRKKMSYTDNIPGYDAGDNPLGDYADDNMCDSWMGKSTQDVKESYKAGIISRARAYDILTTCFLESDLEANDLLDEADREMQQEIIDDRDDAIFTFKPHYMYDCATGEAYYAAVQADHDRYAALGYVHSRSECPIIDGGWNDPGNGNGSSEMKDFRLIGAISILFFGGLILASFRRG